MTTKEMIEELKKNDYFQDSGKWKANDPYSIEKNKNGIVTIFQRSVSEDGKISYAYTLDCLGEVVQHTSYEDYFTSFKKCVSAYIKERSKMENKLIKECYKMTEKAW